MHTFHATATRRAFCLGLVAGLTLGPGAAMAQGEPLVVGQVAPFSGPQAVTGRAISAGAKLVFDAVNARGGVQGRPIRLVTRDDQQKPEETVRLVKALIEEQAPVALLGTVGTSNLEALAKDGVLERSRIPMVGAVSGASSVAQARQLYAVKASYRDEVGRLFSQLAQLGIQRVGVVYQDDGMGRDVLAGAEAAASKHGLELVLKSGYPRNTTEVGPAVATVQQSNAQAVFLGATTAAGIEFVKRLRAGTASATMIYGLSVIDTEALLKALGPEKARGFAFTAVLPFAQDHSRAVVREYLALRQASKDPDLASRSIEGFVAAKALVQALEQVPSPTGARLSQAMDAMKIDLGGFVLDFSKRSGTTSQYVDFGMIGQGGLVVR